MSQTGMTWQRRISRVFTVTEWTALAVGIVGSIAVVDDNGLALLAASLAGIWVISMSAMPSELLSRPLVLDVTTLAGVLLGLGAMMLTGGAGSPFLLFALTPVIRASSLGGFRQGIGASVLLGLTLIAVLASQGDPLTPGFTAAGLALVLAVTVAQIRRLFLDVDARATRAEASEGLTAGRLQRLEDAHSLLKELADLAATDDLNPVAVGRGVLEAVLARHPGSAGQATIESESGPIIVARAGDPSLGGTKTTIPLRASGRRVGQLTLTTVEPLSADEENELAEFVRPVAVAFWNIIAMRQITAEAVQEERTRLARGLHDEIGPSLASLGLALDVALLQGIDESELHEHLGSLRSQVSGLVDEVRSTVTDLRTKKAPSLKAFITACLAELPHDPPITVDIDERRPVRPSLAEDVYSIVQEALRNAVEHSGGTRVTVGGWVDFDRGRVVIGDDGRGIGSSEHPGRYGLVGMRERASRNGFNLDISSTRNGTTVALEWSSR